MSRIVGQERIAELLGVAPKTIVEWQEQGMPIAVRGGPGVPSEYESVMCINWMIDREVKKVQVEKPQDRLARAQAEKIEMENAERRGLLIPAELLEPKLKTAFIDARTKWLESVSRLARELPADSSGREQMLKDEMESFLHRLADWAKAGESEEEAD